MSLKQEKKRRAELDKEDQKPKTDVNNLVKLIKEEDIQKSEKFAQDLKNWVAENKKEPFIFEEASSFFRKHIYDTLALHFPNLMYETVVKEESTSKEIHIYNFDENEKKLYEENKKKEKDNLMFTHVGFTNVVKLLINSKKPLVGHNCYFDLLFLYSHFIDTLPYSYDDFKKSLNKLFPE